MSEARIVLVVLGVLAVLLIAAPIVTVMTQTKVDPDTGLDGEVSATFLVPHASTASRAAPDVGTLFPRGLPQKSVFEKFAASGFTCATDSNAATCFRSHAQSGCAEDWKVRVIFKDDGTVWSSKADRTSHCPS